MTAVTEMPTTTSSAASPAVAPLSSADAASGRYVSPIQISSFRNRQSGRSIQLTAPAPKIATQWGKSVETAPVLGMTSITIGLGKAHCGLGRLTLLGIGQTPEPSHMGQKNA